MRELIVAQLILATLCEQGWKIDACPAPLTHEGHPVRARLEGNPLVKFDDKNRTPCASRA